MPPSYVHNKNIPMNEKERVHLTEGLLNALTWFPLNSGLRLLLICSVVIPVVFIGESTDEE